MFTQGSPQRKQQRAEKKEEEGEYQPEWGHGFLLLAAMVTACAGIHGTRAGTWVGLGTALCFNLTTCCKHPKTRSHRKQWIYSSQEYWPTTPGPPLRPPRSPRPQRRSARLGCRPHSCRWLSLASASASETKQSEQTGLLKSVQQRKKLCVTILSVLVCLS